MFFGVKCLHLHFLRKLMTVLTRPYVQTNDLFAMTQSIKKARPEDVVQTSITMERHLKERYAKLAVSLDLSFSQLVRYALRRIEEGVLDYESIEKESEKSQKLKPRGWGPKTAP